MILKHRRILFSVFVLMFAISAVFVVLYANGYRYHPQKKRVEKTGELVVESVPKKSDILLNGQAAPSRILGMQAGTAQTPATLSYVPSGDYRLELRKEGFYPWTADVTVYSGRSTILKDIALLARQDPVLLVEQQGIASLKRIDATQICYIAGNDVFVFNESTRRSERIYHGSALDWHFLMPSPRGTKLAIRDSGSYRIITVDSAEVTVLEHQSQWTGLQWINEQSILSITPTAVFSVALPSQKPQLAYKGTISGSATIEGAALVLVRNQQGSSLVRIGGTSQSADSNEIAQFPVQFKSIESAYDNLVALRNLKGDLFLFDSTSHSSPLIQLPGGRIFWLSRNTFALTNDYELWVYARSGATYQSTLLTRQSNAISSIFFEKEIPYVFFTADKKLKAIDISGIGGFNKYTLEGDDVGASIQSLNGGRIYSVATFKGQQGLFEYEVAPQR